MKLRTKRKVKRIISRLLAVLLMLAALLFAYYKDKLIETSITIIVFYIFRHLFEKQWHANSMYACFCVTATVLIVLINIEVKITISILSSVIMTFILTLISYYVRDYASDMNDKEYHEDLKEWVKKLKKHDRFSLPKDQVIETAKQMEVKFDEYDEEEYYAIYLMHISDYPAVSNDARMYMGMAKAWLEDKDLKIEPSEKVCKYLYEIVLAEE